MVERIKRRLSSARSARLIVLDAGSVRVGVVLGVVGRTQILIIDLMKALCTVKRKKESLIYVSRATLLPMDI
jgi:hypothetical protein